VRALSVGGSELHDIKSNHPRHSAILFCLLLSTYEYKMKPVCYVG